MISKILFSFIIVFGLNTAWAAPCTKPEKKNMKKIHKKVRHALGHLNVTPKKAKGLLDKATTETLMASSFINKARGKDKKAKSKDLLAKSQNVCKAKSNLNKASIMLSGLETKNCWQGNDTKALAQIKLALKDLKQVITDKKVSCKK